MKSAFLCDFYPSSLHALEEQRGNEAALLKYFEVVGQLLTSPPSEADYLSPVLRAQTLTILEALEPGHKRIVLQFLHESSLLGPEKPGLSPQGAKTWKGPT